MITIKPEAVSEIARRLDGQPDRLGMRIFVRGIGWSGPSLGLALAEPQETDVAVQEGGARVYLDHRVATQYKGAELGWESDPWGSGFTFRHPALGEC